MPELVESLNCPQCGGPLRLTTGEVIVTCLYCGSSIRVRGDKPFLLRHSLLTARTDRDAVRRVIEAWMSDGIMKPDDLRRASRVTSLECVYVPFYVFEVDASTSYVGVLTRTGTNERRSGTLVRNYFWKILARRSGEFAVADYHLPLAYKAPFDTAAMVRDARMLNPEIDEDEAARIAREQVEAHQRELLKDLVDIVESAETKVDLRDPEFIHAPLWFAAYEYRGRPYRLIVDAASGDVVRGDIPPPTGGFRDFLEGAAKGLFRP